MEAKVLYFLGSMFTFMVPCKRSRMFSMQCICHYREISWNHAPGEYRITSAISNKGAVTPTAAIVSDYNASPRNVKPLPNTCVEPSSTKTPNSVSTRNSTPATCLPFRLAVSVRRRPVWSIRSVADGPQAAVQKNNKILAPHGLEPGGSTARPTCKARDGYQEVSLKNDFTSTK